MSAPDSAALLLARLLELSAAEREAFLRQISATDPALVNRMKACIPERPAMNSGEPATGQTATMPAPEPALGAIWALEAALSVTDTENSGARIGPYKLLQKIGEGGFGVVWMAEQQEPIKRRVALKIIKVGMDTEEVIARFEAERQALALMEHSNIAHVFDAGATDAGRPYFVMELVRGVAITRYCDENRLRAGERLRLFVTVCQAVQHAHQKGIIHRDLKPSNILVTLHDGVAVPKIIDFGIAKATHGRLTDKTLFTQFNAFIGTPAYTSPEQMEMSGLDIDTRSDIYSLGVLLYELLTGQPPFDSKALMDSGLEAMRRTIRETDPPRPSHCLGTLSEVTRTSVAHQRGIDATKLSLLLRGDLDWIVMRCLEKDRTRRYESAASLGADVERHLRDDLVEARPPSQLYRTRKFIRRHKLGVFAVAAVTVSLIAGLIAASTLFVKERAAHERALSAERKESELRQRAEVDGTTEVKRVARTALDLANGNLDSGHAAFVAATEARINLELLASPHLARSRVTDGLAYLVYAARKDSKNTVLGPRLASALATHNFLLPDGPAFECGSAVLAVHFTKDGRSIYVGTEDGTLRVFDAASGGLQHQFLLGQPVLLDGWEFPRNNDTVVTVRFADKTFGVYDVKSGQAHWLPRAFDPRTWQDGRTVDRGRGAGISPDGRWLFALGQDRFWIWDAATGDIILQPVFEGENPIGSCDFTMDGGQMAVTVGTSVRRWTLPDARPIAVPIEASEPGQFSGRSSIPNDHPLAALRRVNFSPNGRLVAVSGRGAGTTLFNATTGSRVGALKMPGLILEHTTVVFASDVRIFAAGRRTSGSWDLETDEFTPLPIARGADLLSSSFDATGSRILTTAADGSASICDLVAGELVAEPAGRQDRVCAGLAPDGVRVVTGNATGTLQRFRTGGGSARPLELPRHLPTAVSFLPGAPSRLLSMESTRARVLNAASGREIAGGFAYPSPVLSRPWTMNHPPIRSDKKFVVASTDQGLQAWELGADGVTHVAMLEGSPAEAGFVWFSPGGDMVARNLGPHRMAVWNLRTGALAGPIFNAPNDIRITAVQFSPHDGRLALGIADGACMIIDVATAFPIVTFANRPTVRVHTLTFSPDGKRLVTVNDANETRVWNASTGELIDATRDNSETKVSGLTPYSPDGRWLATWGVHSIRLWDSGTGAPVGETIPVWDSVARFSADSRSIGTADGHGSVRVWDVPSGQPFTEPMRRGFGALQFPEFSSDGLFVRAQRPRKYSIWSVPPRLPEGTPVPEWLLRLATVLATKTVNAAGELIDVPDAMVQFHDVRRQIAALPADAPLAEWGRWILDDRVDRSIAPGFTLTPAEADKLMAVEVAKSATEP